MKTSAQKLLRALHYLALSIISVLMTFPFFWMVSSALKTNDEIFAFPPTLWPAHPLWGNFLDAWHAAPFGRYLLNSIFVAGTIVVIQVINSSMMAYALTQMRFVFRRTVMGVVLISYMLPATATYLPAYIILSKLHLIDTYTGLIISNSVSVFSIFLMRTAFLQISKELAEAAKIDGASHFRILWSVFIPLTRPMITVMSLITFISQYNNYFWPSLITKNPDLRLVSAGLRSFFVEGGAYGLKWPLIMAGSAITIIPLIILFIVSQKVIMQGVSYSVEVNKG
ncbi:carbohydrate ABC transporter permease [Paenibacillus psychroresistens]|uniref:Carbohydrate ABC transporter permease n=1 Tax=Paenibacillus psychroresistens TaxID=1778678 RepID=A0A6B8RDX0_9BACL|nr:carbohydrate ABC transporter permease [Paenibacillus psychroresistens]QGQ93576.1 carbohydrate ABC transporter permease [Paenibacillus psychroresistens]